MANRLKGKVALITGGAAGFGKKTAETLKAEGAVVYISDINVEGGEKVAKDFNVNFLQQDVTNTDDWERVINEIKKENQFLVSTLAVLPDTKEINTFNLEAEASRQKEYVAVRQVISNKEIYKNDLEYFDWFITKSCSQGIMTSESKNLLNNPYFN